MINLILRSARTEEYSKIQNKNNYKVLTMTKAMIFLIGIKEERDILIVFFRCEVKEKRKKGFFFLL